MKNRKIKIVIDTNVFINSFVFPQDYQDDSLVFSKILALINLNRIELVFSQDTVGELIYIMKNKVLHYIKTQNNQQYIMNTLMLLFLGSFSVNTEYTRAPHCDDRHDDMFLKCVVQGKAKYLITNDFKSGMNKINNLDCSVLSSKQFNELYETAKEFVAATLEESK